MKNRIPQKPVVALDIDGTSGDYHGHFLRFAEGYYGRTMPDPALNTDGVPLYKWMRTSKAKYRQCKLAFRQGGMKRNMPMYHGMDTLTRIVRAAGAEVWICTTRPYLRLDNVDPDTREWLRRNRLQYDAVIYGENKYRLLAQHVGAANVIAVADDLPEQTRAAIRAGIAPVLLRDQPYNQNALHSEYHTRVYGADDMLNEIMASLNHWKESR